LQGLGHGFSLISVQVGVEGLDGLNAKRRPVGVFAVEDVGKRGGRAPRSGLRLWDLMGEQQALPAG
jgi:hypothetical protein